jgi:hypothetical protein
VQWICQELSQVTAKLDDETGEPAMKQSSNNSYQQLRQET